ncbi:putative MFS monocarboxylate transporter [Xylariaceae sp. FL0804]|nr:putative MFS monocarboxylate transporter [Xylariaceae sp. FL0804]
MSSEELRQSPPHQEGENGHDGRPDKVQPGAGDRHTTTRTAAQVLSTFIAFTNTWGFNLSLGVFQTYYEQDLLSNRSSSNISWISTTCIFLLFSTGIISGPLYDHGLYRPLLAGGSLLQVFGLMMLSLSTSYYQVFLAHGIAVGLGCGLVFTPSVSAAAASLPDPAARARAMGLVACGSGLGGVVYPLMFRYLEPAVGFPWAVRSIGFVMLGLYLVSYLALMGRTQTPPMVRRFFDRSTLTDLPWILLCLVAGFHTMAYFIPYLYVALITEIKVPSVTQGTVLDLLPIINGASTVGRILAGVVAAAIGPTETCCIALLLGSVVLFSWISVSTLSGTIGWSVFWGVVSGIVVSLPGAFIPLFCPSLSVLGTRVGMFWVFTGLGALIGSPIATSIYPLRVAGEGLWRIPVFAGTLEAAAAVAMIYPVLYIRWLKK